MKDWCRQYIIDHCIERSTAARPIVSRAGGHNSWQLFLRRALYKAEFVQAAGKLICDMMQSEFSGSNYQIAGIESGAVPLLVVLGQEFFRRNLAVNVFSIRKEPKAYGVYNQIEGIPENGKHTILVDDFSHTGSSLLLCRKTLRANGITVLDHAFCLVGENRSAEITVHSLFNLADLGLKS